jgi:hypothetical protein
MREVRREVTEDGKERFVVQPPHDNYWVAGRTPMAAMRNAGYPCSVVQIFSGDWKTW